MKTLLIICCIAVPIFLTLDSCSETNLGNESGGFGERVGDTIVMGVGDSYYDSEHHFRIGVVSLLGDSRCPEGLQCIWAGNAGVRFEIIVAGNYRRLFDLNTHGGRNYPRDTVINGIEFRLVGVEPYPKYNAPAVPEADVIIKLLAAKK
ncbi:hypothetical protein [Parapedobacter sp. 10938]|uniref:hypothetical protein n=1 Tax=Parapedobacter flavus TaxID=3110225 RepID=UPI002DB77843|nr:hypothetical protein [Parapedobacter sp. 10938]MEC3881931.1 hypothetical protein [Parapedobacter sp. 10938]